MARSTSPDDTVGRTVQSGQFPRGEAVLTGALTLAPPDAFVEVPDDVAERLLERRPTRETQDWSADAAARLDSLPCGLVFAIGALRLDYERSLRLATAILEVVREALVSRGLPPDAVVETDRQRGHKASHITGSRFVTALPHSDGMHRSYLTPSRLDVPSFRPALREFPNARFNSTASHKLYQGFVVIEPGHGLSNTTFYDLLAIIERCRSLAGLPPGDSVDAATWLADNVVRMLEARGDDGANHPSLPGLLGTTDPRQLAVVLPYAEALFGPEDVARFPELGRLNGESAAPVGDLYCDFLRDLLDLSWSEFRFHFELAVPSQQFDLVLAHNLTLLHGALLCGRTRVIESMYISLPHATGDHYESWLSQTWRRPTRD